MGVTIGVCVCGGGGGGVLQGGSYSLRIGQTELVKYFGPHNSSAIVKV